MVDVQKADTHTSLSSFDMRVLSGTRGQPVDFPPVDLLLDHAVHCMVVPA